MFACVLQIPELARPLSQPNAQPGRPRSCPPDPRNYRRSALSSGSKWICAPVSSSTRATSCTRSGSLTVHCESAGRASRYRRALRLTDTRGLLPRGASPAIPATKRWGRPSPSEQVTPNKACWEGTPALQATPERRDACLSLSSPSLARLTHTPCRGCSLQSTLCSLPPRYKLALVAIKVIGSDSGFSARPPAARPACVACGCGVNGVCSLGRRSWCKWCKWTQRSPVFEEEVCGMYGSESALACSWNVPTGCPERTRQHLALDWPTREDCEGRRLSLVSRSLVCSLAGCCWLSCA